jgi:hypothetical protein
LFCLSPTFVNNCQVGANFVDYLSQLRIRIEMAFVRLCGNGENNNKTGNSKDDAIAID